MTVGFRVQLKIRKPVGEVFAAVVDPAKLSGYFVQTASAPLTTGATVMWKFAEASEAAPVTVIEVAAPDRIVIEWRASGGWDTRAGMTFTPIDEANTMVAIAEAGWPNEEAALKSSHDHAGGWMHMMACLKAYLEYGINLRAGGAF